MVNFFEIRRILWIFGINIFTYILVLYQKPWSVLRIKPKNQPKYSIVCIIYLKTPQRMYSKYIGSLS
jgi:hypothetical protein